jgi:hypothetical protein
MSKEIKMLHRRGKTMLVILFAVALLALGTVMVSAGLPERKIPNSPAYTSFDQVTGSWWESNASAPEAASSTGAYTSFDQITGSWWESNASAPEVALDSGAYTSFDQITGSWR